LFFRELKENGFSWSKLRMLDFERRLLAD